MADELLGWREHPDDDLVTFSEAVEISGLNEDAVRRLIHRGEFPHPLEWKWLDVRGQRTLVAFYSKRAVERASRTALRGPAAPPPTPAAADPARIPRQPGS